MSKDGQAYNFVTFKPKKNHINMQIKLPETTEMDERLGEAGLETLEYRGAYQIRLTKDDLKNKEATLKELASEAYKLRTA